MPDPNDFIQPLNATGDQGALREALVSRVIYAIADTEDPQDFIAVDTVSGAQPWGVAYEGRVFWLDPNDTTTAHDGITTIVTSDGYRYKVELVTGPRFSVIDNETTAPPGSPALGDSYLVPSGATGDWSGHPDEIAIWTARGWEYVTPEIGMLVYVESKNGFWHYDDNGDWVAGIGLSALAPNSVSPVALLGGRSHWVVVNQTTNTPPGSPSDGVAYIVGPAPTGDWSGHATKIAIAQNGSWIIVEPQEGWQVYDQSLDANYVYDSGWVSLASAVIYEEFGANGVWNKPGGLSPDSRMFVQMWGGGSGGGANSTGGGGGGGSYAEQWFLVSDVPDTVTVTVGAGGAVSGNGGNTSFGSLMTAYRGGAGGNTNNGGGGGGGGVTGTGSATGSSTGGGGGNGIVASVGSGGAGGNGGASGSSGSGSFHGGGGGGGGSGSSPGNGGGSVYGGAGGAGGSSTTAGGTSLYGGNGGNTNQPGQIPGGGGGRNAAGARGEVRVTVFR